MCTQKIYNELIVRGDRKRLYNESRGSSEACFWMKAAEAGPVICMPSFLQ